MQIVVAHMSEDTNDDFSFTLDVKPNDTVSMVKEKMQNHFVQEVYGETLQHLFFAGELLEDGTLSDYNIQEYDVVLISHLGVGRPQHHQFSEGGVRLLLLCP